jgi:hypothetical protein
VSERDPVGPDTDDLEVDEADAIEQSTAVDSEADDAPAQGQDEADPADLAEQARTVSVDDDEYR